MAQTPPDDDPAAHYQVKTRDVEYRRVDRESLLTALFEPQGTGPFPAMINIHGGAWNSGDRFANSQFSGGLAESGVMVASIEFRCGGAHPYPTSLLDINYAIRWVKAHAAEFNADPGTLGGIGVSSGGHLIVLAAMRPNDPRYAADLLPEVTGDDATLHYAITCWGVLNPYARYLKAKEKNQQEMVSNHDRYWITAAAMQEANPVMILERGEDVELPPCLVIHPENDQWMTLEAVQAFASSYRLAGGQCDLAPFEGMPHGIAGWKEPSIKSAVERMKSFIARCIAVPAEAR